MPHLKQTEREKYTEVWNRPEARLQSPAMRDHFTEIKAWAEQHNLNKLVDFGAGSGVLDLALNKAGYKVHMIDLVPNCLNQEVRSALCETLTFEEACLWENNEYHADGVICIDMLEHLPTEHVPAVVNLIHSTAPHGFCNAALFTHTVAGKELHLTLKPPTWWVELFPNITYDPSLIRRKDGLIHVMMVW